MGATGYSIEDFRAGLAKAVPIHGLALSVPSGWSKGWKGKERGTRERRMEMW